MHGATSGCDGSYWTLPSIAEQGVARQDY